MINNGFVVDYVLRDGGTCLLRHIDHDKFYIKLYSTNKLAPRNFIQILKVSTEFAKNPKNFDIKPIQIMYEGDCNSITQLISILISLILNNDN